MSHAQLGRHVKAAMTCHDMSKIRGHVKAAMTCQRLGGGGGYTLNHVKAAMTCHDMPKIRGEQPTGRYSVSLALVYP